MRIFMLKHKILILLYSIVGTLSHASLEDRTKLSRCESLESQNNTCVLVKDRECDTCKNYSNKSNISTNNDVVPINYCLVRKLNDTTYVYYMCLESKLTYFIDKLINFVIKSTNLKFNLRERVEKTEILLKIECNTDTQLRFHSDEKTIIDDTFDLNVLVFNCNFKRLNPDCTTMSVFRKETKLNVKDLSRQLDNCNNYEYNYLFNLNCSCNASKRLKNHVRARDSENIFTHSRVLDGKAKPYAQPLMQFFITYQKPAILVTVSIIVVSLVILISTYRNCKNGENKSQTNLTNSNKSSETTVNNKTPDSVSIPKIIITTDD